MTGQGRFVLPNHYSRLDEAQERGRRDARRGEPAYNTYRQGTVLWDAYNEAYKAETERNKL